VRGEARDDINMELLLDIVRFIRPHNLTKR
jgi:hypothetical protein